MTISKKKKTPARKRGTASKAAVRSSFSRLKRFALSATCAAVASFQVASCSFDPNWSAQKQIDQALASLDMPALEAFRHNGWPQPPGSDSSAAKGSGASVRSASGQWLDFSQCRDFFPGGKAPALELQPLERELCFSGFAVLHSGSTKTPVFVAQRLNRALLQQAQGVKRTDRFYADARLPRAHRAELDDYKHSGYSRGHMAPAGDMHTPEAMAQSFSLANMVPQNQQHNGGPWNQVEQATRKYVMRASGDVYVFTGPVYAPDAATIGAGKVAVPEAIFKLVYDESTRKSWVYWQANSADSRMVPPISYEEFTRRTGLPLLSAVGMPAP